MPEKKRSWDSGWISKGLLLVVVLFALWLPRGIALDRFVTPDEPNWLTRSADFYYALGQRDFAQTYQSEHPGVTTMWAGTGGFLWRYPGYRGSGVGQTREPGDLEVFLRERSIEPLDLLVAGRYATIAGNVIVLGLAFLYTRRLIGTLPALIGYGLIAFDPFHVAHSRFLHLDGLLSSLMFLSVLAYMRFQRSQQFVDLIISGAAAGLSWLTKSPGLFLMPVVGLIALIDMWRNRAAWKSGGPIKFLERQVGPLILWGLFGVGVFVALWPAMWVDPGGVLEEILNSSLGYAAEGHEYPVFFNGIVRSDGRLGASFAYFYPLAYLWRSTPVVLIGLLAFIVLILLRRNPQDSNEIRNIGLGFVLFILVFTVLMNVGTKKFDRYLLPAFLPLDLMAGIGWVWAVRVLSERWIGLGLRVGMAGVLGTVMLAQMVGTMSTYPYYLSYYNPMMGGSRKAPEVMMIGWGEVLDLAAQYINAKPDANQLRVASWYSRPFSYVYPGDIRMIPQDPEKIPDELPKVLNSDYAVIYIHQWQRRSPEELLDLLASKEPEHIIWVNGLEYIRIYHLGRLKNKP